MAREVSIQKAFNMLAEKTVEHNRMLKRDINQRRNGMEDLYGVCFSVYGDASKPATFYISISPDMGYLERFAFKFVIKPYQTTITGGTDNATVTVNNRNLTIDGSQITPNPHNHTTQPHTHNLITGISEVPTTSDDWEVWIAGIDITDYLKEQVAELGNGWLGDRGEAVYPTNQLEEDGDKVNFYDILDVCSVLTALGTTQSISDRDKILKPEFKKVEIKSNAPFGIDAYLYVKYSHLNR